MSALPRRRPLALAAPDSLDTLAPISFPSRRLQVGLAEWFRPGEYARAEQALTDLEALDVRHLRISIPWAEGRSRAGMEWYRWLLPRLARQVEVLPCLLYAPPAPGAAPEDYADLADDILTRLGRHFQYLELWAQPTDPHWHAFCEVLGRAARAARQRGWKIVLGGLTGANSSRLRTLLDCGVMEHIDVVGCHRFPDHSGGESREEEWAKVQRLLGERRGRAQVWITETGLSTWRDTEFRQCQALVEALKAPVPRVYWYSLHDLDPSRPPAAGRRAGEGDYHFGLKRCDGTPKLLFRLWSSGGLRRVREAARQSARSAQPRRLIPFHKAAPRGPRRLPWPPAPASTPPDP